MIKRIQNFIFSKAKKNRISLNPRKRCVLLFAQYSSWGACSNFNQMFNASEEYESWEILETPSNKDGYSFGKEMNQRKISIKNKSMISRLSSDKKTLVIIFDYNGIRVFEHFLRITKSKYEQYQIFVFWTGTPYIKNHQWCNNWSEENNVKAFAMCDLLRFSDKSIPLMQPYNLQFFSQLIENTKSENKHDKIILCHSPGHKGSSNEKGSLTIREVVSKFNRVVLNQIGHKSKFLNHNDCLIEKSKCDIFIDKLGRDCAGGIGKSGIEAIMLGKPTICSMHKSKLIKPYDDLPIIDIKNGTELSAYLRKILDNPEILSEIKNKTIKAREIFSYQTTLNYLNEYIY